MIIIISQPIIMLQELISCQRPAASVSLSFNMTLVNSSINEEWNMYRLFTEVKVSMGFIDRVTQYKCILTVPR